MKKILGDALNPMDIPASSTGFLVNRNLSQDVNYNNLLPAGVDKQFYTIKVKRCRMYFDWTIFTVPNMLGNPPVRVAFVPFVIRTDGDDSDLTSSLSSGSGSFEENLASTFSLSEQARIRIDGDFRFPKSKSTLHTEWNVASSIIIMQLSHETHVKCVFDLTTQARNILRQEVNGDESDDRWKYFNGLIVRNHPNSQNIVNTGSNCQYYSTKFVEIDYEILPRKRQKISF